MTDTWGANRKLMLFSRRDEEQTQWVVEVTDKWGAKRNRMMFSWRQEKQT